jgi:ubiquinone/menaquinone biosynthesis C-methylase UbiE
MNAGRWERAAEQYARGEHRSGADLDLAVEFAAPRRTERVLDVGSGGGHMALALSPRVASVVLTDPVQAMLDASRRIFQEAGRSNAEFVIASADRLPFESAAFDIVSSRLAAHHFEDLDVAWQEIKRVLKPSGIFVLVDTVAPDDIESAGFLHEVETLRDPTHRHTLTTDQWVRLSESNGFHVERTEIVRKAHDFEPWLERGGQDAATLDLVRTRFASAPAKAKTALDIVMHKEVVSSFTDSKLVLAARPA